MSVRRSSFPVRNASQPLFLKSTHIGRKLPQPSKNIRPVIVMVKLCKRYLCYPSAPKDIADLQSAKYAAQKSQPLLFMIVLNNLRFLVRQRLALRGDGDESNSNVVQLLCLHGLNCGNVEVDSWLAKKANKYILPDVQNECMELMALHILSDVSKNIAKASCYSVMADKCTDCSNKVQFTVNIRWVDKQLKEYENFIGLYKVDTIDADSLVFNIKDVLLQMNVNIANCCGQCYDGASNMSGACKGVAMLINQEESCHLHALLWPCAKSSCC